MVTLQKRGMLVHMRNFIIPCDGVTEGVRFLLWRPSKMEAAAHTKNTPSSIK